MMRGVKAPVQAVFATDRNTVAVCLVWAVALLASGIAPYDRLTWLMEVLPVLIAAPVLVATRGRLPLTSLVYALIAVHGLILIYGGAYSYARTPLGFWLQEVLGLMRNPYDRIGHLAQGFVPAMVAREVLLRVFAISGRKVLFFLVVCVCLAISAFYELIEWWAALLIGADADEFLATQGDVWDTQWDMFMALVGAILAQLLLNRRHDRQLARVTATTAP
jgi:putative membrane protein